MKIFNRIAQLLILFSLIYYSQFYKLGSLAYRIWDEARLATSAYEMTKTGNLVVTTVGYNPDMWSTKPPMMIWAQALCIKLHGLNEFSTRFPAALSATFTILLTFLFVLYLTQNGWIALVAATVLCTAQGYIGYHGTRYGEYDSMLTLFTTGYLIALFLYTEANDPKKKSQFLLLFFIVLILATLTKGIAALLFAPAMLLYLIIRKCLVELLTNKHFYYGVMFFLFIVMGYYFLREHYNPGYIKAVYENELGGRFLTQSEGHFGPPDFYYFNLKWERFGNWFWMLPTSLIFFAFQTNKKRFRATLYALICSTSFIAILSLGKTKIWWYDLPTYPLFAVIIGITTLQLSKGLNYLVPIIGKRISLLLVCIIVCAQPVFEAFQFIKYATDDLNEDSFYSVSYYLRNAIAQDKNLNNVIYLSQPYSLQWVLYVSQINETGVKLKAEGFTGKNEFTTNQQIIANQEDIKKYIESNYTYTVKENFYDTKLYQLTSGKLTQ